MQKEDLTLIPNLNLRIFFKRVYQLWVLAMTLSVKVEMERKILSECVLHFLR